MMITVTVQVNLCYWVFQALESNHSWIASAGGTQILKHAAWHLLSHCRRHIIEKTEKDKLV